ncbi:hypothetical protein EJB05_45439, partial [Eragrostis curvula]
MTVSKKFVQAVMLTAIVMAFVVASSSARPLGADGWSAGESIVSGEHILQLLRRLYLQQLGAGPSCQTNSSNGHVMYEGIDSINRDGSNFCRTTKLFKNVDHQNSKSTKPTNVGNTTYEWKLHFGDRCGLKQEINKITSSIAGQQKEY